MAKSATSFARGKARLQAQPKVLVLCEDSKSCLRYLQDAARHFRSFTQVEIAHCGRTDPLGIVEEGLRRIGNYDQVHCAIDRDAHESFERARIRAAASPKLHLIDSHPCYEYWLLLHFRPACGPVRAAGARSAGEQMLRRLAREEGMADYHKGATEGLFARLLDRLPEARARAERGRRAAEDDGELNPGTRLHVLIATLERLGTLQLADSAP